MQQATGYGRAFAVTPADAGNLADAFTQKALYIGGAGDVTVITAGGDTVLFKAVPAGTTLFVQVKQVKATGTSATNIVALGS